MRRLVTVLLASALVLTAAGCTKEDKTEEPSYGDGLFVCNPGNMFGFSGCYVDEDEFILVFDEDHIEDEPYSSGIKNIFDRHDFYANDRYYVLTSGDSIVIDTAECEFDDDEFVLRCSNEDIDPDDVTGVNLTIGGVAYTIDIEQGTLSTLIWGGECSDTFTQDYNSRNDSWSDIEHESEIYPMTCIEPDIEPDVEPDIESVNAATGQFIVPFLAMYTEGEWGPEWNEYLYGFVDLAGNTVYEPQFDNVQYVEELGVYIVRVNEEGHYKFGLMSEEGDMIADIIYDGACYEAGFDSDDPGRVYLTAYGDGVLHVTSYEDSSLGEITDITIDESALPYDAATSNLTLCHMNDSAAVIKNRNEFYPHHVLIDIETGEILHDFESIYGDERIFGDLIINYEGWGGVTIVDMAGQTVLDDQDGYGSLLNPYLCVVATGGELYVIDKEGNEVASTDININSDIDTALNLIAVSNADGTVIYDENLNIIDSFDDVYTGYGYCPGHIYEESNGMFYFVSFDEPTLTNLTTGVVIDAHDDYYYDYEFGYIVADNIGDGNNPQKHWYVYDENLNLIMEGDGICRTFRDVLTGEIYMSVYNESESTFYSLDRQEELFTIEGNWGYRYSSSYNGTFYMSIGTQCMLVDQNGNTVFTYDIG